MFFQYFLFLIFLLSPSLVLSSNFNLLRYNNLIIVLFSFSDIDFESQKHNMQITDLRRQMDMLKREKDKEMAELKELVLSKLGISPTPERSPRLSLFRK